MVAIHAKFNGKVFVPDEPVNLPLGQRVTVSADVAQPTSTLPPGTPGSSVADLVGSISKSDLAIMSAAINEAFEQVDDESD